MPLVVMSAILCALIALMLAGPWMTVGAAFLALG